MSLPRISRTSSSDIVTMSSPRKRIWPLTIRPGSCTRRRIDSAVTLLPQPDSPPMPSVSPGKRSKLTPSTACTTPSSVKNCVLRSLTCSTGAVIGVPAKSQILWGESSFLPRIERVAEAVAQEVEGHQGQRERDGGRQHDVGGDADGVEAVGGHRAPGGRGWRHAQAEEAQEGFKKDG